MNNIFLITFDSCRYDSFCAAKTPNISKLGPVQRRYTFASWTVPAHTVFMMGVSPHESPKGVYASEVYKKDFALWGDRLGLQDISFKGFLPHLSLPAFLRKQGYETHGLVSMPVLNQHTSINNHFDEYRLMPSHNDFNAMLDTVTFKSDRPQFYFMNLGETHYPYLLPGESGEDLPRIHGVHGVFKHMDDMMTRDGSKKPEDFFSMEQLEKLRLKQIKNVEYLDNLFGKLYDLCPSNTHFMVMSDHGECFGEEGYFGHGPIFHEKVYEVFYLEGKRP